MNFHCEVFIFYLRRKEKQIALSRWHETVDLDIFKGYSQVFDKPLRLTCKKLHTASWLSSKSYSIKRHASCLQVSHEFSFCPDRMPCQHYTLETFLAFPTLTQASNLWPTTLTSSWKSTWKPLAHIFKRGIKWWKCDERKGEIQHIVHRNTHCQLNCGAHRFICWSPHFQGDCLVMGPLGTCLSKGSPEVKHRQKGLVSS